MVQPTEAGEAEVLDPAQATGGVGAAQPATYTSSVVVLDPVEKVLVQLEAKYKDVVFDLSTTKGDKEARQARKELIEVRTGGEKAYKSWNAPILAEQKKARERVAEIEQRVRVLEAPIDQQIKADEARRAAEKAERDRIEAERIAKMRGRIATIAGLPTQAVDMSSDDIGLLIEDLQNAPLTEERFGEFLEEAKQLAAQVVGKLKEMRDGVLRREQQAAELARQQEELDRQRAEMARLQEDLERRRAEQAEESRRDQIIREERARFDADKAARDAEDERRQRAGQTDAFAEEKASAIAAVKAATPAPPVDPAPAPATAPAPAAVTEAAQAAVAAQDFDAVNAEAAMAASDDRSEVADNVVAISARAFQDMPPADEESNSPPTAGLIVALVAEALDVQPDVALGWIRAVNWDAVTEGDLRHDQ